MDNKNLAFRIRDRFLNRAIERMDGEKVRWLNALSLGHAPPLGFDRNIEELFSVADSEIPSGYIRYLVVKLPFAVKVESLELKEFRENMSDGWRLVWLASQERRSRARLAKKKVGA